MKLRFFNKTGQTLMKIGSILLVIVLIGLAILVFSKIFA